MSYSFLPPEAGVKKTSHDCSSIKPQYGGSGYDIGAKSELPAWHGRSIAGPKLRLVEFSAFLEQRRDSDQVRKHVV